MPIKPTQIISIRGAHTDPIAQNMVNELIKKIRELHPDLPISFSYEHDPLNTPEDLSNFAFAFEIEKYHRKLIERSDYKAIARGKLSAAPFTLTEDLCQQLADSMLEHDKGLFWLAKRLRLSNVAIFASDLPGIDRLSAKEASGKRILRETHMANKIIEIANDRGGVIFDFGGMSHTSQIQKILSEHGITEAEISTNIVYTYSDLAQFSLGPRVLYRKAMVILGAAGTYNDYSDDNYPLGIEFMCTGRASEETALLGATVFTDKIAMADKIFKEVAPNINKIAETKIHVAVKRVDGTVNICASGAGGGAGAGVNTSAADAKLPICRPDLEKASDSISFADAYILALLKKKNTEVKKFKYQLSKAKQEVAIAEMPFIKFSLQTGESPESGKIIVIIPKNKIKIAVPALKRIKNHVDGLSVNITVTPLEKPVTPRL
ncbi:MAG: hypothetical protein HON32_07220 [Francisellaceae bacterium]|nr:hypothetical protein [Francisellaceae bacterium]